MLYETFMSFLSSEVKTRESGSGTPPKIISRLRKALGRQFGDADGWAITVARKFGAASGRKRSIFRAHNATLGRTVALKAHSSRSRNWTEFRALQSLHRHTGDCVSPIFLDPGARFYAMDWIDAPLLSKQMNGPERQTSLILAGKWLAHLHTARDRIPFLKRTVKFLHLPIWDRHRLVREVASKLRQRMRHVNVSSGPVAMLHGDIHLGNLFGTGERVVAFDREFDCYGLTFLDVAKILNDMADRRDQAAEQDLPWPDDAEIDRRLFFEGYGPLKEEDLPLFDLTEDLALFKKWRRKIRRGDNRYTNELGARGLLEGYGQTARPGRLVAGSGARGDYWSQDRL